MVKKYVRNVGKSWTSADVQKLKELVNKNTPTRVIGLLMGRTVGGVQNKALNLNISLKPTNQSPYNRKNKYGI